MSFPAEWVSYTQDGYRNPWCRTPESGILNRWQRSDYIVHSTRVRVPWLSPGGQQCPPISEF